jgi:hypothetical protein
MLPKRERSIGAKVTESEYELLQAQAEAQGMTLGEWSRELLMAQLKSGNGASRPGSSAVLAEVKMVRDELRAVMAELVALRLVVLNLMAAQAKGKVLGKEDLTELSRFADVERFRRAEERLAEAEQHRKFEEAPAPKR